MNLEKYGKRAACVISFCEGKVLAVSRKEDINTWGLPGGKVEENESFEEAAQREMMEETGIAVSTVDMIPIHIAHCGDHYSVCFLDLVTDYKIEPTPEKGCLVEFKTVAELCDPGVSPFADYNRKAFENIGIL